MLPIALLLLGGLGLWFAAKQFLDFQHSRGDFSEWIVSDTTGLNRRVWRAHRWIQMIVLALAGVVSLIEAFELTWGK